MVVRRRVEDVVDIAKVVSELAQAFTALRRIRAAKSA